MLSKVLKRAKIILIRKFLDNNFSSIHHDFGSNYVLIKYNIMGFSYIRFKKFNNFKLARKFFIEGVQASLKRLQNKAGVLTKEPYPYKYNNLFKSK